MNKFELIEAITDGFHQASEEYLNWSADQTIHDAGIEFMATASISRKIIEYGRRGGRKAWIYLEMPFEDIGSYAGVDKKSLGRPRKILQGRPRVDIAVFDSIYDIKGVIEVKRHLTYSNLSRDFERVCALLEKYGRPKGSLKFGCVVAIRPVWSGQRKDISEVASDIKAQFEHKFSHKLSVHVTKKDLSNTEDITYESGDQEPDEDANLIRGFAVACFYISSKDR